jgi:hypothetical protein
MLYPRDTWLPPVGARGNDPHAPASSPSPLQSCLDGSALGSSAVGAFSLTGRRQLVSLSRSGRGLKQGKQRCEDKGNKELVLHSPRNGAGERRPARLNDPLQEVQRSFVRGAQVRVLTRGCSCLLEDIAMPYPGARWAARRMGCRASLGRFESHT